MPLAFLTKLLLNLPWGDGESRIRRDNCLELAANKSYSNKVPNSPLRAKMHDRTIAVVVALKQPYARRLSLSTCFSLK